MTTREQIQVGAVLRWTGGHHPGSYSQVIQVSTNSVEMKNLGKFRNRGNRSRFREGLPTVMALTEPKVE